ncbi:sigma-70 family RNA polymerase sigma factor [Streptomyces sp. NPDC050636]|uniref:sigma-70 family RNA polymerase sigma factor n=1 Tax=Streptomyces sp. NPDC050636 TaxID=3154510 RepID=UPI003413590B
MPDHHEMSDAELTAALRESESDAPVDELYRRHRSAVLSYARACCRDPHTAEDLASEAFARTLQAVRSGGGPQAAWRPYLLTVVRRTAADWASTARRTELSPDFEEWLANTSDSSPEAESSEERMLRLEDNSLVLRAFRSLPERWQAVLWHTAVEEEPASKVGTLLGVGPGAVGPLASRAREGLREAYLTAHVESGSDNDECRHYSSMLGATVRRAGRRTNKDLQRHLGACERCRSALLELRHLNEGLRSALPVGVLLWGGPAYVAALLAQAGAQAGAWAAQLWAKVKASAFCSCAVTGSVAAATGIAVVAVPMPFDEDVRGPEASASSPPAKVKPKPPMKPSPTEAGFGNVRWTGPFRNPEHNKTCIQPAGTAVIQNSCDGSADQIWQLVSSPEDTDYAWLRNAATGECIDYNGRVGRYSGHAGTRAIRTKMSECRVEGKGQLFRFIRSRDGSHYVHTRWDGGAWDKMQLGLDKWPPVQGGRVVVTYNYNNAPYLRYLVDGV